MLAHGGHWLVSVAYFAPVAGFVAWLVIVTLRERWRNRQSCPDDKRDTPAC
ncbi:MAG: hypothetical protein WKF40_07340 [Thermoleophilaceae bacterium]